MLNQNAIKNVFVSIITERFFFSENEKMIQFILWKGPVYNVIPNYIISKHTNHMIRVFIMFQFVETTQLKRNILKEHMHKSISLSPSISYHFLVIFPGYIGL